MTSNICAFEATPLPLCEWKIDHLTKKPHRPDMPICIGLRGLLCIVRKINKLRIAKPIAAHVSWKAQPTSILEIKYTKDKPVVRIRA